MGHFYALLFFKSNGNLYFVCLTRCLDIFLVNFSGRKTSIDVKL